MKNTLYLFAFVLLFSGCKQKIEEKNLSKINGYWEIEKVILKDGDKKDYKVNETIDYFELRAQKDNSLNGFRQKVMPQFNGKFITNNVKEKITISYSNGDYFINYITAFGKWKEKIITIQDSILILKNDDQIEYNYKRFTPFSLK